MTATVAEPAAPPAPTGPEPVETLVVALPGLVEERIRRLAGQTQAGMPVIVASWLAAGDVDAPVPGASSAGLSVQVPASIAAAVRAEAQRRGLQVSQVAAARLASVAGRG